MFDTLVFLIFNFQAKVFASKNFCLEFIFHLFYGERLTMAYQIKKENRDIKRNFTFKAARQLFR